MRKRGAVVEKRRRRRAAVAQLAGRSSTRAHLDEQVVTVSPTSARTRALSPAAAADSRQCRPRPARTGISCGLSSRRCCSARRRSCSPASPATSRAARRATRVRRVFTFFEPHDNRVALFKEPRPVCLACALKDPLIKRCTDRVQQRRGENFKTGALNRASVMISVNRAGEPSLRLFVSHCPKTSRIGVRSSLFAQTRNNRADGGSPGCPQLMEDVASVGPPRVSFPERHPVVYNA